jgi:hypothetical protein
VVRFLADTGGDNVVVSGDLTQFVSALAVLCEGFVIQVDCSLAFLKPLSCEPTDIVC